MKVESQLIIIGVTSAILLAAAGLWAWLIRTGRAR